jgi:amino acid adenylation domain-containing protein/non-ribosomal peptide synthase protein (TIGR01720 family)
VCDTGTEPSLTISAHDLRSLPESGQQAEIEKWMQRARVVPLDPSGGQSLDIVRLELEDNHCHFVVSAHALVLDRASFELLVEELLAREGACTEGREDSDEPPLQYAELAVWQNEWLESEEAGPGREYWRRLDLSPARHLRLPGEGSRAPHNRSIDWVRRGLRPELTREILRHSAQHTVEAADILLACWVVLLHRLSGQAELVVGCADDGRRHEELDEVIGPLSRFLPLVVGVSGGTPFTELVGKVAQGRAAAAQWFESFDWALLRKASDGADPPAWRYGFEHARLRPLPPGANGETAEICELTTLAEPFDCWLSCSEGDGSLTLSFCYASTGFERSEVERLADRFELLLRQAVVQPDSPVGDLPVLTDSERRRLLTEFNETGAEFPRDLCMHQLIERHAANRPDDLAVIHGDQQITYAQLEVRANQLARHLQTKGVGADTLVAICAERGIDLVVAIFATLKAGGAYVPVDPAYPPERIAFLLEDTRAAVVITQSQVSAGLPESDADIVILDRDEREIRTQPKTRPVCPATPANLVYVIYTSGSTGQPKGVVITHEKLMISNTARLARFGHVPSRFLLLSSFAFDSSVVGIFWTLCGGGTLLLPEGEQPDSLELPGLIARQNVSHLLTLPSFYSLLLSQPEPENLAGLQTVIVAGEACPRKTVERHRELLPETGLFSEYGATETTVFSSVCDCLSQSLPVASLGEPIDNAEMYILDSRLQPVPVGVTGEVYFGGPALALGYLNRPALTAERFIPHPFGKRPGARLYKSGDLARHLNNGEIEFLGRTDNQVKIRGYRVELEEIEIALAAHRSIDEAVVLARADLNEDKRLIAYLVPTADNTPTVGELREFLRKVLPDYMVPAIFMFMESMPRTPNGKVDRKGLPEPGPDRPELEGAFVAPRSRNETLLAEIWADVLGLERVGVTDNFFELGGDSILSIQIVWRARRAGLELTPRQMFEHQTVAELAGAVVGQDGPRPIADQGPVTGAIPLTPVQQWFFDLEVPHPARWNMPVLLELMEPVDPRTLEKVLQALVDHHDALRLRFRREGGVWRQENAPAGEPIQVRWADLAKLPEAGRHDAFTAMADEIQASLDLERGPILRAALFDQGPDRPQLLLLVVHHLAVDGVSWRIILEDLQDALDQADRGRQIVLPAKTTSFGHWARQLESLATSAPLRAEREHWLNLAATALPFRPERPQGRNLERDARRARVVLEPEETQQLLTRVHRVYDTQINDILLTALVHAVTDWTGEPSLTINLEGHGREYLAEGIDLSRTVGWFTTDFPAVLHPTRPFEPGSALQSIKQQLRGIPNQGIGFGLLRYLTRDDPELEPLRRMAQPGLSFNYMGQFDQVFRPESRFRLSSQDCGASLCPDGRRPFSLEVYGSVANAKLVLDWEYNGDMFNPSTVDNLSQNFLDCLRLLIAHCISSDAGRDQSSAAADFNWDDGDLADISRAIERARGASSESAS